MNTPTSERGTLPDLEDTPERESEPSKSEVTPLYTEGAENLR
jgi:hypothetical protein